MARTKSAAATAARPERDADSLGACGCATHDGEGRKAVGVDAAGKARNITRLRRIEGQVRGLQKMIDEERYCADVLAQLSSVQEALRGTGRALLHNHLKNCATEAIRSGTPEQADAMYEELVDLMYRNAR